MYNTFQTLGEKYMDPLTMVGAFLCIELGKFSVADYVTSKVLDELVNYGSR